MKGRGERTVLGMRIPVENLKHGPHILLDTEVDRVLRMAIISTGSTYYITVEQ